MTDANKVDLDEAEKRAAGFRGTFRAMAYDSGEEVLEFVAAGADPAGDVDEIAQFTCDDTVQRAIVSTLNDTPALIAEVRATRAKVAALTAELAAARAVPATAVPHCSDAGSGTGVCVSCSTMHAIPAAHGAFGGLLAAAPRCSCTREAGDSCSECGATTERLVDVCDACRGPLPKGDAP